MSDLILTAALGPAGRSHGSPKPAGIFACLYVGGSGAWSFVSTPPDGGVRRLGLCSDGEVVQELMAGFALAAGDPALDEVVTELLGTTRHDRDVELTSRQRKRLADAAGEYGVAAVITHLVSSVPAEVHETLASAGWSVVTATPAQDSRTSAWGGD
ncbi:hypothetical protein [Kineococcus sp. SYSU DK002]|uniref:hypothetical protein n=1 Tax=Kineococcus sp. SYSU DK002 TaxID=3383123 RepID=UPI003D7E1580